MNEFICDPEANNDCRRGLDIANLYDEYNELVNRLYVVKIFGILYEIGDNTLCKTTFFPLDY